MSFCGQPTILAHHRHQLCPGGTQSSTRRAPRKRPIDLQASFQTDFQSNLSFDLLKYLTETIESLLTDDENFDFELEQEKLRDGMEGVNSFKRSMRISSHDPTKSPKQIFEAKSDPASDTDSQCGPWDDRLQSPASPRGNSQPSQDLRLLMASPAEGRPSLVCVARFIPDMPFKVSAAKLPSPAPRRSPVDSFSIPGEEVILQVKHRRLSTPRRMPSVTPPPAIQTLHIVKHTTAHHAKAESTDDASLRATTRMNAALHERFYFFYAKQAGNGRRDCTFYKERTINASVDSREAGSSF